MSKKKPEIKTPTKQTKTDLKPPIESVMDDDAMIYTREREKTEKQKWSEMSRRDKFDYFLDYYALKTVCVLFIVFCVTYFAVNYFTKEDTAFYILTMNADGENIQAFDSEYFIPFLEEQGIDTDKNIVSLDLGQYNQNNTADSLGMYSLEKIRVTFLAQCVDLLWADRSFLDEMASTGYIADMTEFVPKEVLSDYRDSLIYGTDVETGEEIVTGIRLSPKENEWLEDTGWFREEGIVAVAEGAPHPELIKEMLLDILTR